MVDSSNIAKMAVSLGDDAALLASRAASKRKKPASGAVPIAVPSPENPFIAALRKVEGVVNIAGMGDVALMILGGAAGLVRLHGVKEKLETPRKFLQSKNIVGNINGYNLLLDGGFVLGSALGAYGVAKDFSEKLESLKLMYADMTGKDVRLVTAQEALTGKAPKAVVVAREHLKQEHGSRFIAQLTGLGFNLRGLLKGGGGMAGFLGFMIPMAASTAIDAFMGESPVLHIYKGISEAHKRGEDISVQAYAEFVCAADSRFKKLGVENPVTLKVAEQLHTQKISPAMILKMAEAGQLVNFGDAAAAEIKNEISSQDKDNTNVLSRFSQKNAHIPQAAIVGPHSEKIVKAQMEPHLQER